MTELYFQLLFLLIYFHTFFVWLLTFTSFQQKLEKLEKEGLIEKPFQRKQLKIRFPERGRSGRTVLTINNLQFGFEDKVSIVV